MTSTSEGIMLEATSASMTTSCMEEPCGALRALPRPLLFVAPPTMEPRGDPLSSRTSSPSTVSDLVFRTTEPTPSAGTKPSAPWSKVLHRPILLKSPRCDLASQTIFARTRCTPTPQASSWVWPLPFFWMDSQAHQTAVSEEAWSVSTATLGPLQPRAKLSRPAAMLAAPPVAECAVMAASLSAYCHSLVPWPRNMPHARPGEWACPRQPVLRRDS
mmetsp:Transcript_65197/g.190756  ORF Transcript_65197/g.190756 Transcript_65197/m.190756 type:complete len:216 (+) Transcript_65197:1724-2371(+)